MTRTVLLTGATRGIGRALARQLAAEGFRLFLTGRNQTLLESILQETGAEGAAFDLTRDDAPGELWTAAQQALGRVEVLINNAGFNPGKNPLTEVTDHQIDTAYAVNFRAPYLLCRSALRDMGTRRNGQIINVISSIARTSAVNYSAYCAMKHALHGFTQCLIKEAREVNVKVTGIYPGGTDTDFRPEARPDYLSAESAAALILQCLKAPEDAVIHELVYRPMIETNF